MDVHSSKPKQFCETSPKSESSQLQNFWSKTMKLCKASSIFALDNVKNEAILRDFPQKLNAELTAS